MSTLLREWLQSRPLLPLMLWTALAPWLLFPLLAPFLTAVSLVLLLVLLFVCPGNGRFTLPATPMNSYLVVFLLLTGVAFVVSPLPDVSLPKLTVTLFGAVTFFLLLPRLRDQHNVEQLIILLAMGTGLVVLAGFFSLEWPARQIIDLRPITDRLPHLTGSFTINFNEMAGTLLMLVPFVVAAFRRVNGRLPKLAIALILIALAVMLLFTQSRSGFMGLAVIALVWFLWGRVSLRIFLAVVIVISLALILLFFIMGYTFADVSNWLSILDASSKQGDVAPTSWLTRLDIWRVAGRMLNDYGAIGGGLYTFDPVSRANYVYRSISPSFNLTHAHNLLLQTGTSLGLSGMLALAAIWITVLSKLWHIGRSPDARTRELSAVFAASVCGYLFFNLFDTITFGQKPGLFIWFILAGSMGLHQMTSEKTSTNRQLHQNLLKLSPLILLVVLFLSPALSRNLANLKLDKARFQPETNQNLTVTDYQGNFRRIGLTYYLTGERGQALNSWWLDPNGEDFLLAQGSIALVKNKPIEAVAWYNLALDLAPDSATAYLWRGVANERRGLLGMAEADLRRADALSVTGETSDTTTAVIQYRLGLLLVMKKDWQGAIDAFQQAATLKPEISIYHQILGDVLTTVGDLAGAQAAYDKAALLQSPYR